MTEVIIVGDGPGGLSAALFLAKNGVDVTVVGKDDTPMHRAMLYNYLGVPDMSGSDFMNLAREQVRQFGARLLDEKVVEARKSDGRFEVTTQAGTTLQGDYVIVAVSDKNLAGSLGIDLEAGVDRDSRTNVDGVYLIGWLVRPTRSQAIISAGDGAAAALDILSQEQGKDFHDFDVVERA